MVIIPAIMRLAADRQAETVTLIGQQANRIVPAAAIATILLGVVRGTVFGDIKDFAALGTAYGIWWIIGLVAAVATFAWGPGGRWQVPAPAVESGARGPLAQW